MSSRIISTGEILFDIYPQYKYLGGAPFNFSFHLHNTGHEVAFVSAIGTDTNGNEVKQFMLKNNMKLDFLHEDARHRTGQVLVHLDPEGVPSFIIKKNMAYDYIRPGPALFSFIQSGVDLFYFGTLVQRNHISRKTLSALLGTLKKGTIILFDINLRQNFYSKNIIKRSLSACTVLKANDEELACLKDMFHLKGDEYTIIQKIITLFDIDVVCVTKGSRGASLYTLHEQYHSEQKGVPVIDTVGAGDGFAALLGAGLLHQWPYQEIVDKADRFAGALCSIKGALPADASFYTGYL
ncbi:MAG: carbohydrate kinase [Spirochaetales bacterium]|nr:carbohydrate kinase [Spirochaetales bacterium]